MIDPSVIVTSVGLKRICHSSAINRCALSATIAVINHSLARLKSLKSVNYAVKQVT